MDSWEPAWPGRPTPTGSLGTRIAALRTERGWTQQQLADRLGISRVAVSHLETDLNVPGERTVALLAGCFRMEPHDLVADTTYPPAKSDRLPLVVARWTEVELRLALLERDLWWLDVQAAHDGAPLRVHELLDEWSSILRNLAAGATDVDERRALADASNRVAERRRAADGG